MEPKLAQGIKTLIESAQRLDKTNNTNAAMLIDRLVREVVTGTLNNKKVVTSAFGLETLGRGMEYAGASGEGGLGAAGLAGLGAFLQGKGFGGALKSGAQSGFAGGVMAKVEKGIELILQALQPMMKDNPQLQNIVARIKSFAPMIATAVIMGGKFLNKGQPTQSNERPVPQQPQLEGPESNANFLPDFSKMLPATAMKQKGMIKKSSNNKYSSKDILCFEKDNQVFMMPASMYSMLNKY